MFQSGCCSSEPPDLQDQKLKRVQGSHGTTKEDCSLSFLTSRTPRTLRLTEVTGSPSPFPHTAPRGTSWSQRHQNLTFQLSATGQSLRFCLSLISDYLNFHPAYTGFGLFGFCLFAHGSVSFPHLVHQGHSSLSGRFSSTPLTILSLLFFPSSLSPPYFLIS